MLKTDHRQRLSIDTENLHLYIHFNMPLLSEWDPLNAVLTWMNTRQHLIRETPKATEQFYFSWVFSEASKKSRESKEKEEEGLEKKKWNMLSLSWNCFSSVSYTHLDVYKRQPLLHSCNIPLHLDNKTDHSSQAVEKPV